MATRFTQIKGVNWQPGPARAIATIRMSPEQLARVLHLRFEDEEDDLDRFKAAFLRTPTGEEFALIRYINSPSRDTEIWSRYSSRTPRSDLIKAISALGLKPATISWTHPDGVGFGTATPKSDEELTLEKARARASKTKLQFKAFSSDPPYRRVKKTLSIPGVGLVVVKRKSRSSRNTAIGQQNKPEKRALKRSNLKGTAQRPVAKRK